ncbi:MAG: GIY-YIG nuclease family protein [Myxococcota bacterium]
MRWHVYVVSCRDGSLYTGIATDVERRLAMHDAGKGARYTRGRGPVRLIDQVGPMSHSDALRLERRVKRAAADRKQKVLREGLPRETSK